MQCMACKKSMNTYSQHKSDNFYFRCKLKRKARGKKNDFHLVNLFTKARPKTFSLKSTAEKPQKNPFATAISTGNGNLKVKQANKYENISNYNFLIVFHSHIIPYCFLFLLFHPSFFSTVITLFAVVLFECLKSGQKKGNDIYFSFIQYILLRVLLCVYSS